MERSRLAVRVDGVALAEEEGRALWKEFSEHMDAHVGDFAGFAAKKGWVSVSPEYEKGQAVLVARTTAALPAAKAPSAREGGGGGRRKKRGR
jgi:hypothetical protein